MPDPTGPAVARVAAVSSSTLLIVASAGLGCAFAWAQGSQHGLLMGALGVAMAAGLEIAKPLAVAGAFAAVRDRQLGKVVAFSLLATLAILYSLTAELTGIASARGDLVAERAAHAYTAKDARTQRERIQGELTALGTPRPAATIRAEIAGLLADPRVGDCTKIDGPRTRATCPAVGSLRAELGRAERRDTLERTLATLASTAPNAPAVHAADPGATALATYLGALGFNASPAGISEWLVLVPVLALEIGSALAAMLARSVMPATPARDVRTAAPPYFEPAATRSYADTEKASREAQWPTVAATPASEHDASGHTKGANRGHRSGQATAGRGAAKDAEARIVDILRKCGGRLDASVRDLALFIGAKRTTVHGALCGLLAAGSVARVGNALVLRV
jgi:hypothetical protein